MRSPSVIKFRRCLGAPHLGDAAQAESMAACKKSILLRGGLLHNFLANPASPATTGGYMLLGFGFVEGVQAPFVAELQNE